LDNVIVIMVDDNLVVLPIDWDNTIKDKIIIIKDKVNCCTGITMLIQCYWHSKEQMNKISEWREYK